MPIYTINAKQVVTLTTTIQIGAENEDVACEKAMYLLERYQLNYWDHSKFDKIELEIIRSE